MVYLRPQSRAARPELVQVADARQYTEAHLNNQPAITLHPREADSTD